MKRGRVLLFSVVLALAHGASVKGVEPIGRGISPETGSGTITDSMISMPAPKAESDGKASAFKPNILSRDTWKARKPTSEMKVHKPRYLTIHHTATPQNAKAPIAQKMRNLQQFSQSEAQLATGRFKPSWADIPYHFYIGVNGEIAEGRDTKYVGDTNTPYDPTGHIQIVLEGNFEKEGPAARQLQSLNHLAVWLSLVWGISPSEMKGHSAYIATACPGKNLEKKLPGLRQKMAQGLEDAKVIMAGGRESKGSGREP